MKKYDLKFNPIEQAVILEALNFSIKNKAFSYPKGIVPIIAYDKIAKQISDQIQINLTPKRRAK